jgi:hypothetical protein
MASVAVKLLQQGNMFKKKCRNESATLSTKRPICHVKKKTKARYIIPQYSSNITIRIPHDLYECMLFKRFPYHGL